MAQDTEAQRRAKFECAIAQAKFKQSFKKEEQEALLQPVSLEDSAQFCANLDAVLQRNTPTNVQKCTEWIVKHIAPSKARTARLGEYLVSVSKSIVVDQQAAGAAAAGAATKRMARNRFQLLLIVNDALHADKFHRRSGTKQGTFSKAANPCTLELIELVALAATDKDSQMEKKLRALLNYWAVNQLVDAEDLKILQDAADEALLMAQGGTLIRKRNYLLPDYHGDRTAPWYELPASYMLNQMIRHPERPIEPGYLRIEKLDKKTVSPRVGKLLDNYFENVDLIYQPTGDNPTGETKSHKLSLDPMGHVIKKNKDTGESVMIHNGYGWSKKFCQDMQMHGMPETIKIAREDARRMDDIEGAREPPHRRRDERRVSRSPRRGRQSSSESEYRRERGRHGRSRSYSRGRRQSGSSYDSHDSRSRSRNRTYDRQHHPSRDDKRGSNDRGRGFDDRGPRQARSPPKPYGRGFVQPGSQWNGSNGGNSNSTQQQPPSQPSHNGRGLSQGPPPFSVPPYPPPPLGQFPGPIPFGVFPPPPPPPPPPGGFPADMVPPFPPPPPPPPNFTGQQHPPSGPNMNTVPNNPYNYGNQYGNQQGQNVGYGQPSGYGQNSGGPSGARGGYGGRYPGNRGGYGGHQRDNAAEGIESEKHNEPGEEGNPRLWVWNELA